MDHTIQIERVREHYLQAKQDPADPEERVCLGGLDLSGSIDITAFVLVFPPTKELMKLTLEKRIAHGGHPVLSWMMDNIHIRTAPAGNIKPDKAKSTEKIDGAVAMVMALDRCIRNEGVNSEKSVYNERGLLIL